MTEDERRRAIGASERARHCADAAGFEYTAMPPTDEGLVDLVTRAKNEHGSWVRFSPSGYWLDLVEMAKEILAARGRGDASPADATHADAIRDLADTDPILRAVLDTGEHSGWSRELTLEVAVLMLAAAKAEVSEALDRVLTATADRPFPAESDPLTRGT